MIKFAYLTVLFLLTAGTLLAQNNVSAIYCALNLSSDQTKGTFYWQEIKKKPTGEFEMYWLKDHNIKIRYNRRDTLETYFLAPDVKPEELKKVPQKKLGLNLKGIYIDPNQPWPFYYAIYQDPKNRNSVLLLLYEGVGKDIVGASYYSDKPYNPFKAAGINVETK